MPMANQDEDDGQDSSKTISNSYQDDPISNQDSPSIPTLPSDMVFEILSRLPVTSLIRFRSVCKSWRDLIADPQFIKSQLMLSTRNDHYAHHRLLFNSDSYDEIKSFHLYTVLSNVNSVDAIEHDYPLCNPDSIAWIVGSCAGLVCLASFDEVENDVLFIWNPATRRSTRLPDCGLIKRPDEYLRFYSCGFGYDELSDDYKVAIIVGKNWDGSAIKLMIYSLKTGHWQEIGGYMPCYCPWENYIKFVSGALCWVSQDSKSCPGKIISLDLATESYGEVLEPTYDQGDFEKRFGVLDKQLCMLWNYHGSGAVVWVMKKFAARGVWTKLVTVPYLTDPRWDEDLQLLWISKEGKILLQWDSQLVLYDAKNKAFRDICDLCYDLRACIYVESLVSPDACNWPWRRP